MSSRSHYALASKASIGRPKRREVHRVKQILLHDLYDEYTALFLSCRSWLTVSVPFLDGAAGVYVHVRGLY